MAAAEVGVVVVVVVAVVEAAVHLGLGFVERR